MSLVVALASRDGIVVASDTAYLVGANDVRFGASKLHTVGGSCAPS